MTYFKNVDLASKYNISEATVRNWVKTTKEGKLDLALHEENGRTYVANEPSNLKIIEKLVTENKKYRNTRSMRVVKPNPEFYKIFSQNEIYDIVRNLETHHEIPVQYNYFNGGADRWDEYVHELMDKTTPNAPNNTRQLLDKNRSYLDDRLAKYKKVNVIDIGAGNALPIKDLLERLFKKGQLGRYVAIDISAHMLEIAQHNVKQWFGDKVEVEGHRLDIVRDRFSGIIAKDYLKKNAHDTVNLVLFLGSTSDNLKVPSDAFRTINDSMNPGDLFIFNRRLTTKDMRPQWFNHLAKPGKLTLPHIHSLVFELLNIDESLYDVEVGFDENERYHYARARFRVAVTLSFPFDNGLRDVEFSKGEAILLWRFWQMTVMDTYHQLDKNGFYPIQSSQTDDRQHIMTISEIKD